MKTRARLFAVAIAAALLAVTAGYSVAGPLEDGMDAYRSNDYAKAAELWRPLAEKGNATAAYQLGTLYAEGKGVVRSDKDAFEWFSKAANAGNASAQYNLAASYAEGIGVTRDDALAAKWFRRAADQGMAYAQLNLGIMYANGRGVPQDNIEAVKWFEIAIFSLPPGGARSDAARILRETADKLNEEQLLEARVRQRAFKAKAEAQ